MLSNSLASCGYLLIGCGSSIYRLINHSWDNLSIILPEFTYASAGIAAFAARCLFNLGYHFWWRKYPIDPLLIEEDIKSQTNDRNIIDSSLSVFGLASIIYSLYHHHNHQTTGAIIISSLTIAEIICIREEALKSQRTEEINPSTSTANYLKKFASIIDGYLVWLWILSSGIFGWAVENHYARLATVPCIISMLIYPPKGFYHGLSTRNCLMDYMTLIHVILMTEALCQTPSK